MGEALTVRGRCDLKSCSRRARRMLGAGEQRPDTTDSPADSVIADLGQHAPRRPRGLGSLPGRPPPRAEMYEQQLGPRVL